ncbi:MAG: TetR/AcrR family transcriptional regulator [Myxococcota bacterium]|nr:TetR/AcrR family transcriptional regulator [Myxococcota bacterium]
MIEVARRAFLEHGYAATTISTVAQEAGVSVETVYKGFGGKVGLVRAIYERGLAGRGPEPAPHRSDSMSAQETDPHVIVRNWGALSAEVSPLVSPILLLVRAAAALDPDLAALLRESDEARLTRMGQNARVLAKRGFLRAGVTIDRAAQIMWAYSSPELYDLFVVRRGWTPQQLGEFVASALAAALLPMQ